MARIALFLPSLQGGGVERVMLHLVRGFAARGFAVDMVLARAEGPYLKHVPPQVRVVDLGVQRALFSLPRLIRYVRHTQPCALLSAKDYVNLVAIWACRWARVPTRLVVSVHIPLSVDMQYASQLKARLIPVLARQLYPDAYRVVAVSQGVAADILSLYQLMPDKVEVIYNPVVTPELITQSWEPVEHPWLAAGELPVILGAGRLTVQKDFVTLIRAFARVRQHHEARLIILGEGEDRPILERLVRELGLQEWVALPGFVENPYAWMRRAAVFVLSSRWEGLPTVLVEAMACGTPVVSTDCPSGPREILEGSKWGKLVPVGDEAALAEAICETLRNGSPHDPTIRANHFSLDRAVESYLKILVGS